MTASITRFKKRLQERNLKNVVPGAAGVRQIETRYGVANGKSIVTFSEPVNQLVLTPEQTQSMIKDLLGTLEALEKGVGT